VVTYWIGSVAKNFQAYLVASRTLGREHLQNKLAIETIYIYTYKHLYVQLCFLFIF